MPVVHTTSDQVEIIVEPGSKSKSDFIVRYREPNKRVRTPKHIHLIVDLFEKRTGNIDLTNALVDHIINNIILNIVPSKTFPPVFQVFSPRHVKMFDTLSQFGDYSIEFLLVITELIMIQEKTNYPNGTMNHKLFQKFRDGGDIFSIVSAATFR